jgi:hypothetical protein
MFMKRLLGTRLGVWGRQRVKDSALKYVTLQMRSVGSVRASRKRTGTECGGQKRGAGGFLEQIAFASKPWNFNQSSQCGGPEIGISLGQEEGLCPSWSGWDGSGGVREGKISRSWGAHPEGLWAGMRPGSKAQSLGRFAMTGQLLSLQGLRDPSSTHCSCGEDHRSSRCWTPCYAAIRRAGCSGVGLTAPGIGHRLRRKVGGAG